jgi:hypothetical protein
MNHSIRRTPQRCFHPVVRRSLGLVFFVAMALVSLPGHADPGDFGAMPGLWKMVMRPVSHGQVGKPFVQWHCVDEGADPWAAFATFSVPDLPPCERSGQRRSSTALAWTVSCSGHPPMVGRGRVDFDSAEHYTASIALQDRGEVLRIEGKRYAACTSPSD